MNVVDLTNPVQAIAATIYGFMNIVFKNIQIEIIGRQITLIGLIASGIIMLAIIASVNLLTNTRG